MGPPSSQRGQQVGRSRAKHHPLGVWISLERENVGAQIDVLAIEPAGRRVVAIPFLRNGERDHFHVGVAERADDVVGGSTRQSIDGLDDSSEHAHISDVAVAKDPSVQPVLRAEHLAEVGRSQVDPALTPLLVVAEVEKIIEHLLLVAAMKGAHADVHQADRKL